MLTTGIPQIVAGIAVFLVCGVLLFSGKVRKRYWCLSCLVTALLVGRGVWCANYFFDLGIGTPKVFSPENWEKTKPEQRHFMVDDLQEQIALIGMPEDKVRELLGAPDYQDTAACLSYVIAQPFDEVTLDLTLKSGIVTQVEQTSH